MSNNYLNENKQKFLNNIYVINDLFSKGKNINDRNLFNDDESSSILLNHNNNNNNNNNEYDIDDDDVIEGEKIKEILDLDSKQSSTIIKDQQPVISTTTDLHSNISNSEHCIKKIPTSYSFPGVQLSSLSTNENSFLDNDHNHNRTFVNLSDSFTHLYLPNFALQLSATIMSGLNWINQINATTLFQNFWTTSSGILFRRRSSTASTSSSSSNLQTNSNINDNNNQNDLTYKQYKFAKILNGTIRLQTLKPSELIELSSFGLVELDDDIEPGIGHEFQRYENDKATWCDSCGEFLFPSVMNDSNIIDDVDNIKSKQKNETKSSSITTNTSTAANKVSIQADHLLRTYFQCTKCKYVCHWKCLNLIRIDCRQHSPPSTMTIQSLKKSILKSEEIDDNNNSNNKIINDNNDDNHQNDDVDDCDSSLVNNVTSKTTSLNSIDYTNDNHNHNIGDDTYVQSILISTETSFDDYDESSETTMTTSNHSSISSNNYDHNMENNINNDSNNNKNNNIQQVAASNNNNNKSTISNSIIDSSYLITPKKISDLRAKILKYNERVRSRGSGLGITLIDEEQGLFRGFLRVHMNLTRPINVIAGKRPPSIYDIINDDENNNNQRRTLTSFYMPRDTIKNIHITSDNTTLQVIKAMLKKFKVVDNPQKFALYLRRRFPKEELLNADNADKLYFNNNNNNENEMTISKFLKTTSTINETNSLKRLHDHEKPLILQLEFDSYHYGSVDIVLQENDNADIAWDAFEIPELKNFLKILEREEAEHLQHVRAHYHELNRVIKALIDYEENRLLKLSQSNNNKDIIKA